MAKSLRNMTLEEMKGRQVRLLEQIETRGGMIYGVGTVWKIIGKFKGVAIERVDKCPTCGCGERGRVSKVDYRKVELLPVEEPTP